MSQRSITRILLVEDDPDHAGLFAYGLEKAGYRVTIAYNIPSALDQLSIGNFSLLLTDWQMVEMTGDRLIGYARRRYPAMKTILMSQDYDARAAARACQADGWFHKLDGMTELLALIERLYSPGCSHAVNASLQPSPAR